jgi:hypothetical protein
MVMQYEPVPECSGEESWQKKLEDLQNDGESGDWGKRTAASLRHGCSLLSLVAASSIISMPQKQQTDRAKTRELCSSVHPTES